MTYKIIKEYWDDIASYAKRMAGLESSTFKDNALASAAMSITYPIRLFLYGVEGLGVKLEKDNEKDPSRIEKIIDKMVTPEEP